MMHLFLTLLFSLRVDAAEHKINVNFESQFKDGQWVGAWEEKQGYPKVPVFHYRWLVPYGEKVAGVFEQKTKLDRGSYETEVTYPDEYKPMCNVEVPKVRSRKFRMGEIYPLNLMGDVTPLTKHGYEMIEITLYPVQIMVSENLSVRTLKTEVIIETEKLKRETSDFSALPFDVDELKKMEADLNALGSYPSAQVKRNNKTFLLVAPQEYLNDLSTWLFLEEKAGRGVTTGTISLENIATNFTGADTKEKVRNAIKKHYKEEGTRFAMIVGNGYSSIPTKYYNVSNESIGSDLYFGCFDGDLDLACEVAIGRAPASSLAEYKVFIQKTLDARASLKSRDPLSTLLFGEKMDASTLAGNALEQLVKGGKAGAIKTKGFPSQMKVTRFHETMSKTFSSNEVIAKINQGDYFTVNHMGHASQTYCMRYKTSVIPNIINSKTYFGMTQGCHPGDLKGPNWAASMVLHAKGGPFAQIANSSYGWYIPGSSDGPSNRHHLVFYDSMINEGIKEIGRANMRAKERLLSQANSDSYLKKVLVETNLFGDPEFQISF